MPDPTIPATPQAFTFGERELQGYLTGFSGQAQRRSASHVSPKRDGGREEDMGRAQRRLEVRLVFIGDECAREFQSFEAYVHENPTRLLHHPVAGKFVAFCQGPQESVDFGQALDRIEVRVSWVESELDAEIPREVPDVATAAQNATAKTSALKKAIAAYMGALGKAQTYKARGLAALDSALGQLDIVTSPLEFMRESVASSVSAGSSVVGKVLRIETKALLLAQDIEDYIAQASDVFSGSDVVAGLSSSTENLLGVVETDALELEDELIASQVSNAGAADAVGSVEETLAACFVVEEALKAARPPVVLYTVPQLMDVISLATRLYPSGNALARASEIMGLNRIPNPAAMPSGTRLRVPSR